jgi:ADP-ribosylglycohydrolase
VSSPEDFDLDDFRRTVVNASRLGKKYFPETLADDITAELEKLASVDAGWTDEKIREEFGGGGWYVYRSLPFTYAFFCRDHTSIESVYDCVSAGGDTDSNGSMLASLLGALHGTSIFPQHLIDGLDKKNEIIDVADRLSERFGV